MYKVTGAESFRGSVGDLSFSEEPNIVFEAELHTSVDTYEVWGARSSEITYEVEIHSETLEGAGLVHVYLDDIDVTCEVSELEVVAPTLYEEYLEYHHNEMEQAVVDALMAD